MQYDDRTPSQQAYRRPSGANASVRKPLGARAIAVTQPNRIAHRSERALGMLLLTVSVVLLGFARAASG